MVPPGTTYLGGIVGYTDSRTDNNNTTALQRATVKECVIVNERAGENSAVGGITGYHKGQGGYGLRKVASYDNEISTVEGDAGGVIGRSRYQRGSYVFGARNTPSKGYAGKIENEIRILAVCIQLLRSRIDIIFIDCDVTVHWIPLGFAFSNILELSAKVSAYETLCACY